MSRLFSGLVFTTVGGLVLVVNAAVEGDAEVLLRIPGEIRHVIAAQGILSPTFSALDGTR